MEYYGFWQTHKGNITNTAAYAPNLLGSSQMHGICFQLHLSDDKTGHDPNMAQKDLEGESA